MLKMQQILCSQELREGRARSLIILVEGSGFLRYKRRNEESGLGGGRQRKHCDTEENERRYGA